MYSNSTWIFKEILDCGLDDIRLLDDMKDFDLDIIQTLKENEDLSLSGIFEECFRRAKESAAEEIQSQLNDLLEWLKTHKQEIIKLLCSDTKEFDEILARDELFAELSDKMSRNMIDYLSERCCEDKESAEEEYSNIYSSLKKLDPSKDLCMYFNYQASGLFVDDYNEKGDLYSSFFKEELSEIEEKMGLHFTFT